MDAVRQPEYTGENRCMPCTIVNTGIAAVGSAAVAAGLALGTTLGSAVAVGGGIVVFAVCAAAIYLRGYLVPKTPELTKRYFPERVLAWFDKEPEPGVGYGTSPATAGGGEAGARTDDGATDPTAGGQPGAGGPTGTGEENGEGETFPDGPDEDLQPEAALLAAGAVEECADVDDLCLDDEFRAEWREAVLELRERDPEAEAIVEALSLPEMEGVAIERYGDAVVLERETREIGKWESSAALVADLAAAGLLAERYPGWDDLNAFDRSRLLRGLRIFAEQCPECDGPIALGQEKVESCCRSFDVVAVTCEQCDSRLFEEQLQEGFA